MAVAIPVFYAATRWAWALGVPLGISEELFRFGQSSGLWAAGAALATLAAAGGILTLGLAARWGERWPGWVPIVGGNDVPMPLVIVPAVLVALLVTSAGLMFIRLLATGRLYDVFSPLQGIEGSWAAIAPELLWPAWGAALAIAAYAYRRRRQGGRDAPSGIRARG
ncbi:MAG: hypothetical protein MUC54_07650 [Chloroflexi bacterium]|nr:hypothetical protein [Chloroflexota bacterium]